MMVKIIGEEMKIINKFCFIYLNINELVLLYFDIMFKLLIMIINHVNIFYYIYQI